jgi:glycosyltransferase involved in cell wall biosynthesis
MLTCVASLSLAIWLYLTFARGAFWRLRPFDDDEVAHQPPHRWPRVVAILPARNEAETISQTVAALLQQDYPGEFSILLVDDHSEDSTSRIALRAAQEKATESRLTIRSASEIPPGWTGKLWALHEGVSTLDEPVPAFFWFTDADIVHAPDTLRRLVARAEQHKLDLTSLMVLLQAQTLHERALIPAFLYFFLQLYPPRWIADSGARTAFTQLRYSTALLLGTLVGLFLTYLAPIALLFAHHPTTQLLGLTAWLLMSLTFLPTVRFYRLSPFRTPLLPLTALFYSYATCLSALRYWLRRGGQWKGRAQAPRAV